MAHISGVDLPREERVEIGLTYIYGIGGTNANRILAGVSISSDTCARDLTDDEVERIATVIGETQMMEGSLRRGIATSTKRPQEIGCYHGIHHRKSLPVHGQKTKTNARTRKGLRKTVADEKK